MNYEVSGNGSHEHELTLTVECRDGLGICGPMITVSTLWFNVWRTVRDPCFGGSCLLADP